MSKQDIISRMAEDIEEVKDRSRRIETKLSRYISGEDDRGVTKVVYKLERGKVFHKLHLHTPNVTLLQVSEILTKEGVQSGDEVDIYDDGRFVINVAMR